MASTALPRHRMQRPVPRVLSSAEGGLARIMPLVLLVYSAMLPLEIRFSLADQMIYPFRAAVLLLFPWLLGSMAAGRLRLSFLDFGIFAGCAWMLVSFMNRYGAADGMLRGGALVLDVIGPYLVTRLCIRDANDVRRLLIAIAPGVFLSGVTMMIESVTHVPFVRPAFAEIFGKLPAYEGGVAIGQAANFTDIRLGLLRSSGPFAHPILAGLFLASMISMFYLSGIRGWPRLAGLVAGAMSFFSVSSAAILAVLLIFAFAGYERLQRHVTFLSWRAFIALMGFGLVLVQLLSQGGLVNLMIRLSLNPATGYYRRQIWMYGSASVANHPWFGIGYDTYARPRWMSSSVDNFWLVLALRHGLITPILFFVTAMAVVAAISVASLRRPEQDRQLFVGIAVTVATVTIMGFTVAFFGGMMTWYFAIIAMGVSLSQTLAGNERRLVLRPVRGRHDRRSGREASLRT